MFFGNLCTKRTHLALAGAFVYLLVILLSGCGCTPVMAEYYIRSMIACCLNQEGVLGVKGRKPTTFHLPNRNGRSPPDVRLAPSSNRNLPYGLMCA
jgi:hypothetical protein